MTGDALVLRGDAGRLPLADQSVDLIITSPPYFGQRSYRDGGEHYPGQIGDEPTPQEFLDGLWKVTAECWRVLKPEGSMWVNLGDKRSGSGAPGTTSGLSDRSTLKRDGRANPNPVTDRELTLRRAADERRVQGARSGIVGGYTQAAFGRAKSKMLLPHRYAIGCEDGHADPDGIGWIVRQDGVWWKPNGMPESVSDRTRDAHEYWFHLTRDGDYYAAVDEIREPHSDARDPSRKVKGAPRDDSQHQQIVYDGNPDPRGALPPSVWRISTQGLRVPPFMVEDPDGWRLWGTAGASRRSPKIRRAFAAYLWDRRRLHGRRVRFAGVDHFAAFPAEWPRRLILGWSPSGICLECGQGRQPVVDVEQEPYREATSTGRPKRQDIDGDRGGNGMNGVGYPQTRSFATITGYRCACDAPTAPTRPAVVLDPFGGTGTTAMIARALGRRGISVDLSLDYTRLARWRVFQSGQGAKAVERTNAERQGQLL